MARESRREEKDHDGSRLCQLTYNLLDNIRDTPCIFPGPLRTRSHQSMFWGLIQKSGYALQDLSYWIRTLHGILMFSEIFWIRNQRAWEMQMLSTNMRKSVLERLTTLARTTISIVSWQSMRQSHSFASKVSLHDISARINDCSSTSVQSWRTYYRNGRVKQIQS